MLSRFEMDRAECCGRRCLVFGEARTRWIRYAVTGGRGCWKADAGALE